MVAQVGVIPRVTGWHGTSQLHPYFVCEVFTCQPLEGNQLGVFVDGRPFTSEEMQPNLFRDIDPAVAGRDAMPQIKEVFRRARVPRRVISDQSTNWALVPCPHVEWARVVYPDLDDDAALERLWRRLTERRFGAIELRGPGTELRVGLLPSGSFISTRFQRRSRRRLPVHRRRRRPRTREQQCRPRRFHQPHGGNNANLMGAQPGLPEASGGR